LRPTDAGSARPGVAQAVGYAGTDPARGIPMVVTPAGHVDRHRLVALREGSPALIREFDTEAGQFVADETAG